MQELQKVEDVDAILEGFRYIMVLLPEAEALDSGIIAYTEGLNTLQNQRTKLTTKLRSIKKKLDRENKTLDYSTIEKVESKIQELRKIRERVMSGIEEAETGLRIMEKEKEYNDNIKKKLSFEQLPYYIEIVHRVNEKFEDDNGNTLVDEEIFNDFLESAKFQEIVDSFMQEKKCK